MAEPRKQELMARLQGMGLDQLKAGLATRVAQAAQTQFHYLKFDGRSGVMNVHDGDKESRFPDNVELVFNLLGSKQGYICWKGGQPIDQFEQTFFETLVPVTTMTDHSPYEDEERDGWQQQYQLFFKDLAKNTQYVLRLVSKSGLRQVDTFIRTIHEQAAVHDFTKQTPVVTISAAPFLAQQRKNYKPVFKIERWLDNPKEVEVQSPVTAQLQANPVNPLNTPKGKLKADDIEDSRD